VLDVWDFISGTSDECPYDPTFAANVRNLISAEMGSLKRRILDLGGGSGNPSIALALDGHQVDLVDLDDQFTNAARRRSRQMNATVDVITSDWRRFLHGPGLRG